MSNKRNRLMRNETGQVILVLILVMTVALAIGISVIQRSILDISTASKVEQSSRAFSAAEAGIENKLIGGSGSVNFAENSATAQVSGGDLAPVVPAAGNRQDPLEYPPLAKEEVAQIWLADYTSSSNPPAAAYTQSSLDIYWGNSSTDKAALELTLIYYDGSKYTSRKWYLDNPSVTRDPANNFDKSANCNGSQLGSNNYQCYKQLGNSSGINNGPLSSGLMLLRARLLYNTASQPFAVQAVGTCGANCSLPPQVRSIISTGTAGTTQRKVKLFQINKVVPSYLDYAIFSTGAINK
ncbi:MAG: pilus assembly PilX N-terminal domain-containing protein [Candidatus Daviesbacteria bacterium]|nr:pilus assembly PilX N-terminal domain-containing protein [Candidatus Daviesbacteria bacterium]